MRLSSWAALRSDSEQNFRARSCQLGQENHVRTARTGLSDPDNRTAGTGQPGQVNRDRTAGTGGQPGQETVAGHRW
jgi:hypothetical protein